MWQETRPILSEKNLIFYDVPRTCEPPCVSFVLKLIQMNPFIHRAKSYNSSIYLLDLVFNTFTEPYVPCTSDPSVPSMVHLYFLLAEPYSILFQAFHVPANQVAQPQNLFADSKYTWLESGAVSTLSNKKILTLLRNLIFEKFPIANMNFLYRWVLMSWEP